MDLVEVLSFLFMLSTMELGRVRSLHPQLCYRSIEVNRIWSCP